MKNFRCSIWGDIEVSPLALSIIDTWEFQRLHYIKQTGFAYKIFPSATSSRFEHSIGVYHITKYIINHLQKNIDCQDQLSERDVDLISIIGLVHDLGHGPFSHTFDYWLKTQNNTIIPRDHEERSVLILKQVALKYKIDITKEEVEWICTRITNPPNEKWYDTLVCNPYSSFDTDKLDYLIRDARHFGFHCGFDFNRIIQNMKIIQNKLCFCDRVYSDVEKLFNTREEMHRSIYRHPTIEKFQDHFLHLLNTSNYTIASLEDFLNLNDVILLHKIPFHSRMELETRRWKNFHAMRAKVVFHDNQKKKALQNILWYKRKEPTKFFLIKN